MKRLLYKGRRESRRACNLGWADVVPACSCLADGQGADPARYIEAAQRQANRSKFIELFKFRGRWLCGTGELGIRGLLQGRRQRGREAELLYK